MIRHKNDDIPKHKHAYQWCNHITALTITLLVALATVDYGQEAGFVSFIADTHIEYAITCSPDGKNVYAGGVFTIVVFSREADGTLKTRQILNNDHKDVQGIHNIIDLVVSHDGRYLYTINSSNSTMLIFGRDRNTGEIVLTEIMQDSVFTGQFSGLPAVERFHNLLLSPDGKHLYWLYNTYDGKGVLVVLARNLDTGHFKKVQVLKNGDPKLGQLNIPRWITISPDGNHLYAGGGNTNKLMILSRNLETGQITYVNNFDISQSSGEGWTYGSITISPDGGTVYVTNLLADKLFVFARNQKNGELQLLQTFEPNGPRGVVVSPNGKQIYFVHYDKASYFAHYAKDATTGKLILMNDYLLALDLGPETWSCMSPAGDGIYLTSIEHGQTVIKRDTTTNQLTILQHFNNDVGGTDRLAAVNSVTVSPDGNYLYTGAENAINVFVRNPNTGRLTLLQSYPREGVHGMALAPDGNHLYATRGPQYTIEVFARNHLNGTLQLDETIKDSAAAHWAWPTTFSPDGRHFFITDEKNVAVFARELSSGRLTLIQRINGADYQLGQLFAMTVSPDGTHFYWSGADPRDHNLQIATFSRDSLTGHLNFLRQEVFGTLRPSGTVEISPDGLHLYITLTITNEDRDSGEMIGILSRDRTTGKLFLVDVFHLKGWFGAGALTIAANGIDVYAIIDDYAADDGLLIMLERSPETGRLKQRKVFKSWCDGVLGLAFPGDIALSPDGAFLYVADHLGGVVTFATGRGNNTAVETQVEDQTPPQTLALHPNHPNPFNPATLIKYDLLKTAHVTLTIYDVLGRRVRTLVDELMDAGYHSQIWDGKNDKGVPVASGIYFYRLQTAEFTKVRKMTFLR
ncbi:MAG: beta-propeller fold lactonase family protein [candidate division KSB1 bacterium]|nr:beta-propeller fold lactonase family protein [candidate division KSB1 bacterium]MDZ7304084.1 beta-propeller fold lactonase family protein [candidate division KSB1 bacterium]MDZ7312064.1 beta-propeller fold lactonase family protein [candidate division KSB1 bacterium]